jgi:hypothetical protein
LTVKIRLEGKDLSDGEKQEIVARVNEAMGKLEPGTFELIENRLKEMATWYKGCYKTIDFGNFDYFYSKVSKDLLNDEQINRADVDFNAVNFLF